MPQTQLGCKRHPLADRLALSSRLRANAALLQFVVHSPGGVVSKADLHGLAADLLRQASEAEELEAMAGQERAA
jgi:hypothetical protein